MIRYVLTLIPPRSFEFKGFGGFAAYSIVMDALETRDPYLVRVRRAGRQADFAVRPLRRTEEGIELDVTAMSMEVARALFHSVLAGEIATRHGTLAIGRVRVEEVNAEKLLRESRPVERFRISFLTPTFFRPPPNVRGGVFVPLPIPSSILKNLHRVWNTYLGDMEDELERQRFHEWLDSWGIVVSGHRIRTVKVDSGDKFEVGLVGWANFAANKAYYDGEFLRKVDALLRLGEYVNVGVLRSKGFGMIRYKPLMGFKADDKSREVLKTASET